MNDIERVKDFGKTLKAFRSVADQLNRIADLNASEKEAKSGAEKARSDYNEASGYLLEVQDKLAEGHSLLKEAYTERDAVNKSSRDNANHILSSANKKSEDMIQNAHDAANQIRQVHEVQMSVLQKEQTVLLKEIVTSKDRVENLENKMKALKESLG